MDVHSAAGAVLVNEMAQKLVRSTNYSEMLILLWEVVQRPMEGGVRTWLRARKCPNFTDTFFKHLFLSFQAINELQKNGMNMSFSFLNYAQSSQCRNWQDSSVSYAAGALMVHWTTECSGMAPAHTLYTGSQPSPYKDTVPGLWVYWNLKLIELFFSSRCSPSLVSSHFKMLSCLGQWKEGWYQNNLWFLFFIFLGGKR